MGMFANVKPLQLPEGFHDKPKKKHGLAKGIAGTIGDYLMQQQGMAPVYAPTMARQREIEQAQQLYNQQRRDEMNDWVAKQQWELANPAPPKPTAMQANYEWLQQNHPNYADDYLKRQTNDVTWRQLPNGQWVPLDPTPQLPEFTEDDWNNAGGPSGNAGQPF